MQQAPVYVDDSPAPFAHYAGDVYMQSNPRSNSDTRPDFVFARFVAPGDARVPFIDCDKTGHFSNNEDVAMLRSKTAVARYLVGQCRLTPQSSDLY